MKWFIMSVLMILGALSSLAHAEPPFMTCEDSFKNKLEVYFSESYEVLTLVGWPQIKLALTISASNEILGTESVGNFGTKYSSLVRPSVRGRPNVALIYRQNPGEPVVTITTLACR